MRPLAKFDQQAHFLFRDPARKLLQIVWSKRQAGIGGAGGSQFGLYDRSIGARLRLHGHSVGCGRSRPLHTLMAAAANLQRQVLWRPSDRTFARYRRFRGQDGASDRLEQRQIVVAAHKGQSKRRLTAPKRKTRRVCPHWRMSPPSSFAASEPARVVPGQVGPAAGRSATGCPRTSAARLLKRIAAPNE